ncbi:MAG UNVERIFIED_CONTAM: DUF4242 domain-containing protein [Microcystis novacekii LVE1205-3]|jgi:hypothetical protein
MTLYLVEDDRQERTKEEVSEILERIATLASKSQGELIEALIGETEGRLFLIIKAIDSRLPRTSTRKRWAKLATNQGNALDWAGLSHCARAQRQSQLSSTVEFTPGLTMETYLQRKAEKTPLYAQVPEVSFERTYVCEDLSKCLCFYDSPDEAAVKRAREVVGAPIDSLTSIENIHP